MNLTSLTAKIIVTSLLSLSPLLSLTSLKPSKTIPFRVMSYNVENLFDINSNPLTDDNDFLPSGSRRWTGKRYYHKLQQIAKVITAAGEWDTPALVGLCEVENDTVLTHLLTRTPLRNSEYRYCMTQGSDRRGINVALLYQRDKFRYIHHQSVQVRHRSSKARLTRDILHVWGNIISGDTLDIAVCHLPSKYGGEKESESRRMDAAHTLRELCDSLISVRRNPYIIIMGDFNEVPESKCLQRIAGQDFHNPFAGKTSATVQGSQKYRDEWSQLDQILVYNKIPTDSSSIRFVPESARTLSFPFLLAKDKTWKGKRPFRTYHGYKYEGGFSDHLPVIADFLLYLPEKE